MGKKADDFLERLTKIDDLIVNKEAERKKWIDMAKRTTSQVGGDRVQSSSDPHKMENKVVEAAMIDEEIASLKAEKKAKIKTIEKLKHDQYDFLHKVYIQGMSFKEIHTMYGRSYSWATTMHRKAKDSLEKLL